jgi:hypothetical protein
MGFQPWFRPYGLLDYLLCLLAFSVFFGKKPGFVAMGWYEN